MVLQNETKTTNWMLLSGSNFGEAGKVVIMFTLREAVLLYTNIQGSVYTESR